MVLCLICGEGPCTPIGLAVWGRLHWQISQHRGSWAAPRSIHPTGIRNAAGFDWHPVTGALLFVGMERDNMPPDHNNAPDDVLVAVQQAGTDYGWPYCHWWAGLGRARSLEGIRARCWW